MIHVVKFNTSKAWAHFMWGVHARLLADADAAWQEYVEGLS